MTHSAAHDASPGLPCRADRGGYVIVALSGELGIESATALREQLFDLLRVASHLILDLAAVEQADASGLAVLVGSGRRARLLGGSLRLAAPSPEVARVLSITGMDQHLNIFPTVRAAITGRPDLPEVIFPSGTVPAGGHTGGLIAGPPAYPARPATELATARRARV
jgi:anti-sigma B factor antagonist